MDEVHRLNDSDCYIPSSEPFTFHRNLLVYIHKNTHNNAHTLLTISTYERRIFKLFISNQNYFRFYKLICCDSIYNLKRLIQ
jgi:hypothetical protein